MINIKLQLATLSRNSILKNRIKREVMNIFEDERRTVSNVKDRLKHLMTKQRNSYLLFNNTKST